VENNSLVSLAAEARQVESMILSNAEANGGEINLELESYLDEIKSEIANKPDHYKFVLERLTATSEELAKQADEFSRAAQALDRTAKRIKDRIKEAMDLLGTKEISGYKWTFKLGKAQPRLVIDEQELRAHAPNFLLTHTTQVPDKERIKALLLDGAVIPGATLEYGDALRSSINKGK